jgi:hypothetical protein
VDGPSFTKSTHGYGQPFGQAPAPSQLFTEILDELFKGPQERPDGVLRASADEEWAGPGFTVRNEESTT